MSLAWVLGSLAAVLWVIPVVLVFRHEIRALWTARNDKWFRDR